MVSIRQVDLGQGGMSARATLDVRTSVLETRFADILGSLATKADLAELKFELQKGINETRKWMMATIIGMFLSTAGLVVALANFMKPPPTTASGASMSAAVVTGAPEPVQADRVPVRARAGTAAP
jgi:hypothetical protein